MSFEKADRLDAMTVRKVGEKNYWTKIGVAFPAKQGPGWNVMLDAIPAPVEGQFKIMLMAPKPKDGNDAKGGMDQTPQFDTDSDIPF